MSESEQMYVDALLTKIAALEAVVAHLEQVAGIHLSKDNNA